MMGYLERSEHAGFKLVSINPYDALTPKRNIRDLIGSMIHRVYFFKKRHF